MDRSASKYIGLLDSRPTLTNDVDPCYIILLLVFEHNKIIDISELQALPVDQKIEIIGQLWDNIDDSKEPITLAPSVIAEIDRRRAELSADPSLAIARDELWRRVNQARKSSE